MPFLLNIIRRKMRGPLRLYTTFRRKNKLQLDFITWNSLNVFLNTLYLLSSLRYIGNNSQNKKILLLFTNISFISYLILLYSGSSSSYLQSTIDYNKLNVLRNLLSKIEYNFTFTQTTPHLTPSRQTSHIVREQFIISIIWESMESLYVDPLHRLEVYGHTL